LQPINGEDLSPPFPKKLNSNLFAQLFESWPPEATLDKTILRWVIKKQRSEYLKSAQTLFTNTISINQYEFMLKFN
jgi:hypothetical protein